MVRLPIRQIQKSASGASKKQNAILHLLRQISHQLEEIQKADENKRQNALFSGRFLSSSVIPLFCSLRSASRFARSLSHSHGFPGTFPAAPANQFRFHSREGDAFRFMVKNKAEPDKRSGQIFAYRSIFSLRLILIEKKRRRG